MRYLGGKSKIRKKVAAVLETLRSPGQTYFEPFVGGGWILQEMSGFRIAADGNEALITMYQALQAGWVPPDTVTEETWREYRNAPDPCDPMTAFCGFGCSFGGMWFASFAKQDKRPGRKSYAGQTAQNLAAQLPRIQDVVFTAIPFHLHQPVDCIIYCDPPYIGTTSYGACEPFDHDLFWMTMREWRKSGNTVVVSEYQAPEDWTCIAEFNSRMGLRQSGGEQPVRIERLFI